MISHLHELATAARAGAGCPPHLLASISRSDPLLHVPGPARSSRADPFKEPVPRIARFFASIPRGIAAIPARERESCLARPECHACLGTISNASPRSAIRSVSRLPPGSQDRPSLGVTADRLLNSGRGLGLRGVDLGYRSGTSTAMAPNLLPDPGCQPIWPTGTHASPRENARSS
jgi:hypothetical protein